jgi:RHS repeat-associated protein
MRHASRAACSASMSAQSIAYVGRHQLRGRRWRHLIAVVFSVGVAALAVTPGLAAANEWSLLQTSQATSSLDDVSCEWSDADWDYRCMAVGPAVDHQGVSRAQVLTSVGRSWESLSIPALAGSGVSQLTGVSCDEYAACMVVGNHGESGAERPVALRREGSSWSLVDIPEHPDALSSELSGVTCAFECMAVGSYVDSSDAKWAFAVSWDGAEGGGWSVESLPIPDGAISSELSDVSCGTWVWPFCTAAGSYVDSSGVRRPLVLDWSSGAWTAASTPVPDGASSSKLVDVSCESTVECTAVGSYRDATDAPRTLAMSRASGGWSIVPTPNPGPASSGELSSVVCKQWLYPTDCVAVGRYSDGSGDLPLSLRLAWGGAWEDRPVPLPEGASPKGELAAVSCALHGEQQGGTHCAAVGSHGYGELAPRNFAVHSNEWIYWDPGESGGLDGTLRDVSCVAGNACVGTGSISQYDSPHSISSWKLDDGGWSLLPNPPDNPGLSEISCAGVDSCTAVGGAIGEVRRWDGGGWTAQSMPDPGAQVAGVSCASTTGCVAVGHATPGGQAQPFASIWDGTGWSSTSVPSPGSPAQLSYVACASAESCVGVGHHTVGTTTRLFAAHWNGGSWSLESIPSPPGSAHVVPQGVSCSAPSHCLAIGSHRATATSGTLQPFAVSWDGSAWALQPSPPISLQDVSCPSSAVCVAVGASAAVTWDGSSWSEEPLPSQSGITEMSLRSISCSSTQYCVAAGSATVGSQQMPVAIVRRPEQEPPAGDPGAVALYAPTVVNRTGATLHWSRFGGAGFGGYEVHRGATAGFVPSASTRLASIDNVDLTTYRDDSAAPGSTVFYKVVTAGRASNWRRAALPAGDEPALSTLQLTPDLGEATWIGPEQPAPGECPSYDHSPGLRISSQDDGRALLQWDLRDIPPDGRVRSARLRLYRGDPMGAQPATFAVRPVSREWHESVHADCQADSVNWQSAHEGVEWTAPGGDAGAIVATEEVPAEAPPGWDEWDVTTVVQEWLAGARANHGLTVRGVAGEAEFHSDDSSSAALRPKLEIVYDDPEPVHVPTVTLIAPQAGERVSGTLPLEASAGDDRRVQRVEFLLDGQEVGEDATAPYSVSWNSGAASNGSHTLSARAVDDVGNTGLSEPMGVEVANFAPPTVALTNPPANYADTVKLDGPAGYWRLGETSGTVAQDASGNGRNGTYSGSFTLSQTGLIASDANRSVRLSSGSGRVTLSNLSGQLGSQFTVEAWIKHSGLTSNNTESRVVARNAGSTGGWKLGVRRTSTGAQEAFFNFGSVTAPVGITPTSTSVYHLVGVYDGTAIRLYVDGNQVAQANASGAANTSAAPLIGGTTAAHLQVDDVALYPAAFGAEKVKAHSEVGRGRAFWVQGDNELRATASAASGRTLREVVFLVDDQLVGRDDTAPYSVTWNTLAAGAPVPDGPRVVTARAVDDHARETASAPVTVNVANNTAPQQQAELTAESALPETLVDEQSAPAVPVDVRIRNKGTTEIASTAAALLYRWVRPDGSFDDSLSGNYALGGSIAPGAHRVVRAMVRPPSLPPGLARSRMTLRFDLRDTGAVQTWWASRGNPPLDHSVMVQRPGAIGLGLERYYQYDGESLGGGMSQFVNLASGNNIVRFSPFAAPGRGLSTVVDLTYNAHSGETKGSALGDGWLLSVSSLSPFGEPLRCGVGTDSELKPDKCEEYALKDQQDLPSLALELTDADGTVHRFTGRRTGGRTFWRPPQGLHMYLHQLEADEQPACDILESGMAYQPDIQPGIRALWAFTRPDGTTFYYQRNGWPTGVADRNGNCLDLELTAPPSKPDRVRVSAVIDAAGVASPSLRPRRTFAIDYYDDEPHPLGGKTDFPKVKSIRDHTGSKLSFQYYKDDRPLRITQEGGTTPDGLAAPSRSWVFTYADWDIDEVETVPNLPNPAARVNPDPTITDNSYLLYSVRDPRGHETRFTYHGEKPQEQKDNAGKLKHRVDRVGAQTTYNYNLATDTTTVDLPLQRQGRHAFDAEGSVLTMTDKVTPTREETTRVSWTDDRHVLKVTEPTGAFTEFAYDQNGYLTKRWDQLRRLTELQYEHIAVDDDDQPSGWVDTLRTIPHISQLTKRITPRGKQWQFDHDDATGDLVEVTDPEGFASRYEYDETGNLTLSRHGLDGDGNLPEGEPDRTTEYAGHDANGQPTTVTDALGNLTRLCSDDDGLLRWVQDARHAPSPLPTDWSRCFEHPGRPFRAYFDYDPFHRMARTSEPRSSEHDFGQLLWTHARYDANDNVVEDFGAQKGAAFRPGEGTRTAFVYDPMDRLTSETLFDFDTSVGDDGFESVEREETTEREYDEAGRLERLTNPRGVATTGVPDDHSTAYTYDLLDRPVVITRNGVGETRSTHLCFDDASDLRSITSPRETPIAVTCGTDGAPTGTRFTWRRDYTLAHELRKVIDPTGDAWSRTYDADGNPEQSTDPEGAKVTGTYNGRGQPVEVVEDFETGGSPRRLTTRFAYDAVGNLKHLYSSRSIDAARPDAPTPESDFVHTTEYDGLDRPIRELLPRTGEEDQRYVHRRFDAVGNLSRVTVPVLEDDLDTILGSAEETRKWVTKYTHFDPGWIRTSDDVNGEVGFDYSPEGWQTERRPPRLDGQNRDTSRDYYRDGLLRTITDELGNRSLRRYDLDGNLTFLRDSGVSAPQKAMTLDLDHNGFGEIASTTAREEGRPTKVTTYGYWLDGLLRNRADDREQDASGVVREPRLHQFAYDDDGRLSEHLDLGRNAGPGDDKRTTHSYFPTGRERERVVAHRAGSDFEARQTTLREYFANGLLRTLRTYGGAVGPSTLRESHKLGYHDPDHLYVGHMTSDEFFRESPAPGTPCGSADDLCTQSWKYDGGDRLIEETDGQGVRTTYDLTPAGGIEKRVRAGEEVYRAEFDGTRVDKRTEHGETERLHYDGEGNLDCVTTPEGTRADCGGTSPRLREEYTYDYRNRLAVWNDTSGSQVLRTRYEHDALDRPVRETEVVGGSTTHRELSYVGATRLLAEEQETGAHEKTRSYSHDAYGRLTALSYRSDGGAVHELTYAYDPRGSVSMLLDEEGEPKAAYGYTAYGGKDDGLTEERMPGTGDPFGDLEQLNSFRYDAKRTAAVSDTIDMGARHFAPSMGQFLQMDRYEGALADLGLAMDPLTANRYSLAGGNPVSFVESDGHDPHGPDTHTRGCFTCGPSRSTAPTLARHTSALHQATTGGSTPGTGSEAATSEGYPSGSPRSGGLQPGSRPCDIPSSGPAAGSGNACGPVQTGSLFSVPTSRCAATTREGLCAGWDGPRAVSAEEWLAKVTAPLGLIGQGPRVAGAATSVTSKVGSFIGRLVGRGEPANEGIYVIRGAKETYVGQSGDISRRLSDHVGRFTQREVDEAERIAVSGGKTAREIAEQHKIDALGGIRKLGNIRNPIGERRFHLMPEGYARP